MTDNDIYVTRPFLPPLEDFLPYVEEIWNTGFLTNGGPLHQRLEKELADYLGVEHLALFNNGTIALITALQALDVTGEVITTPFSFVATTNALIWNKNTPVFVDIDPVTLNLDPAKIEAAITEKTTAILPVHCYGNPCDMDAIRDIADRHSLKVVYDAAHAFGVHDAEGSVLARGDLSILSLHATKVFNTFEGGAIICRDAEMKQHIDQLKNFGIVDEMTIKAAGCNGKMSEIHAAMGLAQLGYIDQCIHQRGEIDAGYRAALADIPGLTVLPKLGQTRPNFAYFPILVDREFPMDRDELYEYLQGHSIYTRRYFHPLLSNLPMYADYPSADPHNLPVATDMALRVLCLPIYPDMGNADLKRIIEALQASTGASIQHVAE
jgi:dTDP-4-amino-4,6-dideoxygalactose transaminase